MPTVNLSRRKFSHLLLNTALAAPMLLTNRAAHGASHSRPFRQPPLDPGRIEAGRRVFDLSVAKGRTEFFLGHETDTIGINSTFLGPVLQAKAGDRLRMNVANRIAEPMTLHWHGLHLPASADGGPHQSFGPGETWSPEFDLLQKAGTFWFHGHQHHQTGAHVWAGMAGILRVEDDEEAALALPRNYGEDDFILILQDRRFDATFQMPYALNMHTRMTGLQGDQALVNGQMNPVLETDVPRIRLRLINASNGSIYWLRFADKRTFWQIASDGGLLAAAEPMPELLLAPGERAEVIIELHNGEPAFLQADVFGAEAAFSGAIATFDFMEIRPRKAQPPAPALPARLAEIAPVPEQTGVTRHLRLDMTGMGMMGDFTINGARYDHSRIDFAVPLGAVETWVIENTTPMLHPMHVHDVQFRILTRNGIPVAPQEAGLKDVVLVDPGQKVELRMAFSDFSDPVLPYMYHCHILEHEDAGMMGQFTVV
ncbi:MAG: multicopper oxidase domain-containing protein [Paracoccaceae bacterium]|nr:multicopper oxidase domain-containing protein [Paracoccaceae bacterium]